MSDVKPIRNAFNVGDFVSYTWCPNYKVNLHATGIITDLIQDQEGLGYDITLGDEYTFEYRYNDDEDMYVVEDTYSLKDRVLDKLHDIVEYLR